MSPLMYLFSKSLSTKSGQTREKGLVCTKFTEMTCIHMTKFVTCITWQNNTCCTQIFESAASLPHVKLKYISDCWAHLGYMPILDGLLCCPPQAAAQWWNLLAISSPALEWWHDDSWKPSFFLISCELFSESCF